MQVRTAEVVAVLSLATDLRRGRRSSTACAAPGTPCGWPTEFGLDADESRRRTTRRRSPERARRPIDLARARSTSPVRPRGDSTAERIAGVARELEGTAAATVPRSRTACCAAGRGRALERRIAAARGGTRAGRRPARLGSEVLGRRAARRTATWARRHRLRAGRARPVRLARLAVLPRALRGGLGARRRSSPSSAGCPRTQVRWSARGPVARPRPRRCRRARCGNGPARSAPTTGPRCAAGVRAAERAALPRAVAGADQLGGPVAGLAGRR